MTIRNLVAVAIVWALSLVGVAVWAQGNPPSRVVQPGSQLLGDGPVITGENFGFQRVLTPGDRPGKVTGRIVVKINGQWMEAVSGVGIVRTP